jgi:hypothetical protein
MRIRITKSDLREYFIKFCICKGGLESHIYVDYDYTPAWTYNSVEAVIPNKNSDCITRKGPKTIFTVEYEKLV